MDFILVVWIVDLDSIDCMILIKATRVVTFYLGHNFTLLKKSG
jgi:hypothetical protein